MDFESFYQETFKACFRFFYYKNVEHGQIEDLVQEAFVRFYEGYKYKLADFAESKKILLGIALNLYRQWVHKQVSTNMVKYIDELEYEVEVAQFDMFAREDFETELEYRKTKLREIITHLNPVVRKVVELKFIQGLTRSEIATKLNMTEDQVHTYQKRGVKYLKDMITQLKEPPPGQFVA